MHSVVHNDYHFATNITRNLIRKMKVLANIFLPTLLNPILFKPCYREDGCIIDKRFQAIVESVLFTIYCLVT